MSSFDPAFWPDQLRLYIDRRVKASAGRQQAFASSLLGLLAGMSTFYSVFAIASVQQDLEVFPITRYSQLSAKLMLRLRIPRV